MSDSTTLPYEMSGRLPDPNLRSRMIEAGCTVDDADRAASRANNHDSYTHYRITKKREDRGEIVLVDTYLLDSGVDSKTGELVAMPHGTITGYQIGETGDGAYINVLEYGG